MLAIMLYLAQVLDFYNRFGQITVSEPFSKIDIYICNP